MFPSEPITNARLPFIRTTLGQDRRTVESFCVLGPAVRHDHVVNRTLRRVPGVIPAARRVRCLARAIAAAATSVVPVSIAVRRTLRALRARPGWVPSEGIELVDGLNVALRQLGDADGGNRWLHHRWLAIFDGQFDAVAARLDPRADFDVLCMGAGSRGPLALPLLLFLGGARCIHVVDPELDDTLPDWRLR